MAADGDRWSRSPYGREPGTPAEPGWYIDPKMADTQRYWDGSSWTDHVAPLDPEPEGTRLTSRKIAFGVFWGILAAGAAFAFVGSCEDQQRDLDHLECLNDNVERTLDGGYQRDCSVYQ